MNRYTRLHKSAGSIRVPDSVCWRPRFDLAAHRPLLPGGAIPGSVLAILAPTLPEEECNDRLPRSFPCWGGVQFAVAVLAILVIAGCGGEKTGAEAEQGVPEITAQAAQADQVYACPMHPQFVSGDPHAQCPICGMDVVAASIGPQPGPARGATVQVSPEMIQTMGVRTVRVETARFDPSLRAFGNVVSNERLESVSVARLEGWIEDLAVRAEGDEVERGALLYRVYSPALIAAQKDFLAALEAGRRSRIDSGRQRLISDGMQAAVIDQLVENREVIERLPVYAEAAGTVAGLQVREGDYVKPGTPVMRLQSYARVWVIASIPEADLALVAAGQTVSLDFPSAPDAAERGKVDYIYPVIDPRTRTADVRIEVDNASGALRPGAYADIQFSLGAGAPRLSVPTEALLRDSRGEHVIVALGGGRFAGRTVETGATGGGRTEILAGLGAGEMVVVSGQFMLDSEANLREGLAKLESQPDGGAASGGHRH